MEGHGVSRPIQGESAEVGLVVGVIEEDRLAMIAAGDDVVEESPTEHPWQSSHAAVAGLVPLPKVASGSVKVKA
jgi:hypothetical protein